jgi:hypothetical protein
LFGFDSLRLKSGCSSAGDEVHDNRDDGKDQQYVNEEPSGMEHYETAYPENEEYECQNEKHVNPAFFRS